MNKTEIKDLEEKEQVEKFFKTKIGQEWYEELGVVYYIKSETPDFKITSEPFKASKIEFFEDIMVLLSISNLPFAKVIALVKPSELCVIVALDIYALPLDTFITE